MFFCQTPRISWTATLIFHIFPTFSDLGSHHHPFWGKVGNIEYGNIKKFCGLLLRQFWGLRRKVVDNYWIRNDLNILVAVVWFVIRRFRWEWKRTADLRSIKALIALLLPLENNAWVVFGRVIIILGLDLCLLAHHSEINWRTRL